MRTLIAEYLSSVQEVMNLLRAKLGREDLLRASRLGTFPREGWLDEERGIHYSFHGVGCVVESGDEVIDFDFGSGGAVDGFDLWRLRQFLGSRLGKYPELKTVQQQELAFFELVKSGEIVKSDELPSPHLYKIRGEFDSEEREAPS